MTDTQVVLSTGPESKRQLAAWHERILANRPEHSLTGKNSIYRTYYEGINSPDLAGAIADMIRVDLSGDRFEIIDAYLSKPGIGTATALLRLYNVPIVRLYEVVSVPTTTSPVTKKRNASGFSGGGIRQDLYRRFVRLDTLHDLNDSKETVESKKRTADMILNGEDESVAKQFISNTAGFTSFVTKELIKAAGLRVKEGAYTNETNLEHYALLMSVMVAMQTQKVVNIVLDGVIDVEFSPDHFMRKVLHSAFILMLFANVSRIRVNTTEITRSKPDMTETNTTTTASTSETSTNLSTRPKSLVETVNLIDGGFNTIDHMPLTKFYNKFLKAIQRASKVDSVNLMTSSERPKYFEKWYKPVEIDGDNVKFPDTGHVFGVPEIFNHKKVVQANPFDTKTIKSINQPKVQALYEWHRYKKDVERSKLYTTIMDVNFLRDAWRADVAISTGSAFITSDKLAYIYYLMIAKWCGVLTKGFYFYPDANEVRVMV